MATMFRQDITQSVEPAAADTSGLARAGQATANIFKTLEGVTGEMAEGYQKGIIENISNEAFGITEQFLQDNMVSQQAAEKAGQVSAARGKAAQAFEEQMFDPNAADWTEIEKRGKTVLGKFDEQLQRLKLASQGGMSQDQYVARVSALTREAIGKYPGLTDKIRASVGTVTGLEGADRWAEMQFVKRMFSATKSDTPSEMDFVKKDIDDMSAVGTYGSREQLWNEYSTDREAYNRKVYGFKQYQAAKTQTDGIKNFVEGAQAQSDLDADQVRAGFTAIFSGNLGSLVLNEATSNKENVWSQTLQSMAQGGSPEIDPVKFKVQIDAHNVQMRTNIEKSRQTSLQSLDVYFANNPNISSKKRDEMRADINNAADVALRTYADDKGVGLGAMAAVLSTYRDKSLKEQSELVDLAIKQQTAMQNNPLVMAYWSGGAQRENLKKTQPHFYAFMENQERLLTSSVFGVRDIIQGATDLSTVNNGFKNAADNPGAVPTPPEQDPKVTRAFHEGLMATARTTVDKADKGNVLTPSEVNIISSAIATSIDTGANGRLLMTDYKKLGEKIGKMPEAESAVIKDNASSAMQTTVAKIQGIKRNLEAKYGVTMQIGVNSAGQIAAVIPVNLQNRPLTQPAQPNLQTAISEFNKTTAALTNNIVYGRSMLTGEDVKAVGADFANVINSGQGYGGFFSLAAQPVAGAGRGVVNPPMAGGEQPAAAQPAASSGTLSVGDVVNGYKYLGGDPNSEASWSAQ